MSSGAPKLSVETSPQAAERGLFQCGSCKKGYTRLDHLSRHVRTHTKEQPYSCLVCKRTFARQDLHKRHTANHYPTQDNGNNKRARQAESGPSSRVTRACGPCSRSKLKCEEEKPCRRCVKKNLQCVWTLEQNLEGSNHDAELLTVDSEPSSPTNIPLLLEEQVAVSTVQSAAGIQSNNLEDVPITRIREPLQIPEPEGSGVIEYDGTFYPDFVYNVVIPAPGQELTNDPPGYLSQAYTPRGFMDYGFDKSIELNYLNFDFLNNADPNELEMERDVGEKVPHQGAANGFAIGAEAFRRSTLVSWTPRQRDHGFAEQANFSLPQDIAGSPELQLSLEEEIPLKERLTQPARDKILAMVLEGCRDVNIPSVLASFPTTEILHNLIQTFFKWHWPQVNSWVHVPSFKIHQRKPEFLAALVAAGALRTSMPIFRRLGFALQEAIRLAIPKRFDGDNTTTRDLQLLQAYFLNLDIGLWSGNKRKIEMAESFGQPGITMLRRARRFHRSTYAATPPTAEDDNRIVEQKWLAWTEQESMKRLVYHSFIRDAQTSMSLNVNPVMSYAEVGLPLPAARDLWVAETATQWKNRYLSKGPANRLPSLVEALQDMSLLTEHQSHIDTQFSGLIVLYGIWALIWEYHQCESISKGSQYWNELLLNSRHRELSQLLRHFRLNSSEWHEQPQSEMTLVLELVSMHLHMSLEELQLYAGKEDPEAARKVNESARQWITTPASRSAVCHAGKLIQTAKSFPTGLLRDFYTIAVYQAALAFWSYAVVSRVHGKNGAIAPSMGTEYSRNLTHSAPLVWLDGSDLNELEKFITLGRGEPCVKYMEISAPLADSASVMRIVRDILRNNCAGELPPPLVENLSQLLHDLGQAARVF